MKDNVIIQKASKGCSGETLRKPGRPRAIPDHLLDEVLKLYRSGQGYRAIAKILESDHGLSVDYSSARRALLRLGQINKDQGER